MSPLLVLVGTFQGATTAIADPSVKAIAQKHKKTPAQILLKLLISRGGIVIPKSVKQHRIKENFDLYDFELTEEDLKALDKLDKGEKGRTFNIISLFPTKDDVTKLPEYPYTGVDDY